MKHLFKQFHKPTTIAIVCLLTSTCLYLGMHTEQIESVKNELKPPLKKVILPVLNAFRPSKETPEQLTLSIAPSDMDTIRLIRERALSAGVLSEGKDRWFPVLLTWKGDSLTGKIRLKGGLSDHFQTDKWSYRIRLDKRQTIMGCGSFSIQHPNTRNFNYEWLFHQALQQEKLPFILYDFVTVKLNGQQLGLHAFEEHFTKRWSEKHDQVEGPVMKYDDENRIKAIKEIKNSAYTSSLHPLASWFAAPVDAFQLKKILKDSAQATLFRSNAILLEQFRNAEKNASEVFDITALAKLFALADVLGAQHAQDWRNLRFARKTDANTLIPIGFDGNAGEQITYIRALREQRPIDLTVRKADGFYEKLFNDPTFYKTYIDQLRYYAEPTWIEQLLTNNETGLRRTQSLINQEFPRFQFEPEILLSSAVHSRASLIMKTGINVYIEEDGQHIAVSNMVGLPIELIELTSTEQSFPLELPCVNAVKRNALPAFQRFKLPEKLTSHQDAVLAYSLCHIHNSDISHVKIKPWTSH